MSRTSSTNISTRPPLITSSSTIEKTTDGAVISVAGIALLSIFAAIFIFAIIAVVVCMYKRRNKTEDPEEKVDYEEREEHARHEEYMKRHAALRPNYDITDNVVLDDVGDSSLSDLDPFDTSDGPPVNSNAFEDVNDNRVIIGRSRSMNGIINATTHYNSNALDDSDDDSFHAKESFGKTPNRSVSSLSHKGILKNTGIHREKSIKKVHIVDCGNNGTLVDVHASDDVFYSSRRGDDSKSNSTGTKDSSKISVSDLQSKDGQGHVRGQINGEVGIEVSDDHMLDVNGTSTIDRKMDNYVDSDDKYKIPRKDSGKASNKPPRSKNLKTLSEKLFGGSFKKDRESKTVSENEDKPAKNMNGHMSKPGLPLHELVKPSTAPFNNASSKCGVRSNEDIGTVNGVTNHGFDHGVNDVATSTSL